MKLQDTLHGLLILSLVAMVIKPELFGLLSVHSQKIFDITFLALLAFVYYTDVIFVKKQDLPIPPPQV